MSGICGAWSFDGREPDLEPVLALLERRGPEGTRAWAEGPVALGHTLLATTPEALVEALPLTDEDSGCTITADVRLDNRDELIPALGLGGETRTIGDGELILRAYLRWGEECPKHLLGDFAFAIWDPRATRLFCARDHMGMRQFNYCHLPGRMFAFATEDTALLALDAVPRTLNESRIADFIADLEGSDFTSTFFQNIHRLPPAHSVSIGSESLEIRRYWQLSPGPRLELHSDEAYGAAFLEVFTQAVRCRMRTAGGLGAMLSGGLDSSSIVAVGAAISAAADKGPLRTISAVGPDPAQCPETQAIQSALTIPGLDPIWVNNVDFNGKLDALISEMKQVRNPFEIHGTMTRSIYLAARDNGLNVVLDGAGGDVVLTSDNRIASLISQFKFKLALREAKAERHFWKLDNSFSFLAYELVSSAWVAFVPIGIRSLWRTVRLSRLPRAAERSFLKRVGFRNRRLTADGHIKMTVKSDPARRAQCIVHPNLVAGRERYDRLAGAFGVESRDPFMDVRVINFCLSLPAEQMQDGGWTKVVLRRGIAPLVPEGIAWRRGKEHLGGDFSRALLQTWENWQESLRDPQSPIASYLSKRAMRELQNGRGLPLSPLTMRLFALDRFLRTYRVDNH